MKFVKGRPFKNARPEDAGWYLLIDTHMETLEFTCDVCTHRMQRVIFDPHNENKKIPDYTRIAINTIPILQMSLLLGERTGYYMNKNGGMCISLYDITEEIEADTWPEVERIEVLRWPNGVHWFAKVDGTDVVDAEGNVKWNTAKEAERQAKKFMKGITCDRS